MQEPGAYDDGGLEARLVEKLRVCGILHKTLCVPRSAV